MGFLLTPTQPPDATLTALAAYNTNGLLTQTAADTFVGRAVTGTAAQITVTNGDGVAGAPTLSLPAVVDLTGTLSVGVASHLTPLEHYSVRTGAPSLSSSANGNASISSTITTMWEMGHNSGAPYAVWFQVKSNANSGAAYPMDLQPLGGGVTVASGVAVPAGGAAAVSILATSTAALGIYFGSGAPSVAAAKGSLYIRTDGSGIADRAYINTNGSTTWTAIATAG